MHVNYLHRQCSRLSRSFFEDYDLLPSEVKQLLQEQSSCPNFDDLKEAWVLAGELFKINLLDGKLRLNSFEKERKEEEKRKAKEEREQRRRERWNRKYGSYTNTVYIKRTREDTSKHGNLVRRVIDQEEAARLLTKRKENKDVRSGSDTYWEAVTVPIKPKTKTEEPVAYMETGPKNSAPKQWNNS